MRGMSGGLISALWVVLWASGFIAARVSSAHADPLTFLLLRYGFSIAVFGALALHAGAAWPRTRRGWGDALVAGALIQGLYLGGVFWAMWHGLPTAVAALVGGLQPLLAAAVAPLLGERVTARQWLGITLGFGGVALVVAPGLGKIDGIPPVALTVGFAAMLAFTAGTFWQKQAPTKLDPRVGGAIQFIGALVLTAPIAALIENGRFDGSAALWGAMAWCVLGISVGGTSLLLILIARGAASRVVALLYLVPPTAALMAFVLLGETLTQIQAVGMALSAVGVLIAVRSGRPADPVPARAASPDG
jgi:drug/metabolite transporter (DMT)-like permease